MIAHLGTDRCPPGLTGRVDFSKLSCFNSRHPALTQYSIQASIYSPQGLRSFWRKVVVLIHETLRLDISPSSPHAKRRIWQEAISTIFLTAPSCKIPKEQRMNYAESPRNEYAPYLLKFLGSPGERHAENVRVSVAHRPATDGI